MGRQVSDYVAIDNALGADEEGIWDHKHVSGGQCTNADEIKEDLMDQDEDWAEQVSLSEKLQNSWIHLHASWQLTRKFGEDEYSKPTKHGGLMQENTEAEGCGE